MRTVEQKNMKHFEAIAQRVRECRPFSFSLAFIINRNILCRCRFLSMANSNPILIDVSHFHHNSSSHNISTCVHQSLWFDVQILFQLYTKMVNFRRANKEVKKNERIANLQLTTTRFVV